ncbi:MULTISPECIES: pentapeptide repeat-containing protein [unclassified Microcoleus]|uniref:pentapeptide repeat-containing protein n=1 Tax=unclassified Microcoleus TaxID=2642155 RepID=UPI002FD4010B
MNNNTPKIEALRESFARVYDGPDRLQREYDLVCEAKRLNMEIDIYRRLYDLRSEEPIDPYPKTKNWWNIHTTWAKWALHLPTKKKWALLRKGSVKLLQSGIVITVVIGLGRYVWEAPKRQKQAHYQAWTVINSALGQNGSGGRIQALQDLNKDGVSLQGLKAPEANLEGIKLEKAQLGGSSLEKAWINKANLKGSNLNGAWLKDANLSETDLSGASLDGANLNGANLKETHLNGAKNLTPEQVKAAQNWETAHYDQELRDQLGLP